jgi:hypothetical protein
LFSEASFGHTGYSGSSIWIDPKQDLFVILLTTRLNYQDVRAFNLLRSDISTIAAAEFRQPGDHQRLASLPDLTRVSPRLYHPAHRSVRTASHRRIRMVAALSEAHGKSHRQYGKKNGKLHHRKSRGLSNRA